MRLLQRDDHGGFSLTTDLADHLLPPYAILSHTWGDDGDEVTFQNMTQRSGNYKLKPGYRKIQFCGDQAVRDGLRHFWVDTCCIDKSDAAELQKSINSMFRWYKNAVKCYVYLADVSMSATGPSIIDAESGTRKFRLFNKSKALQGDAQSSSDRRSESGMKSAFQRLTRRRTRPGVLASSSLERQPHTNFEPAFRNARWLSRGWTLQELLAPSFVEFFDCHAQRLGDKSSLENLILGVTGIPIAALRKYDPDKWSIDDRMSWIGRRETRYEEDMAYSLCGIFDVFLPLLYGEGKDHAFLRLREEAIKRHENGSPEGRIPKAQLDLLLSSLRDDNMNTRSNQIDAAHTDTFEWIFDTEAQRPWDSFPNWLTSSDKIYWISGKAGSGKSTLMKFLVQADRTAQLLNEWTPGHMIYSYFIWNSGTAMQRSAIGLLCSLVYQILAANHEIIKDLFKDWPVSAEISKIDDWSRESLELVLFRALTLHERPVMIFLDGLDELDTDAGSADLRGPYYVLQLVEIISSLPSVKICVSSRPEPAFNARLRHCPKLQVQDLTKQDVEVYTRDFVQYRCSFGLADADENMFIEEVVDKAEGVFLWVSLVLQSLQRGLDNGDRPDELMYQLRRVPRKLEQVYENMFERLGEDQDMLKETAAVYLNVFISSEIDDLDIHCFRKNAWIFLIYAIAMEPALRNTLLTFRRPPDLQNILLDFNRRLISRSAGLLESVVTTNERVDIDALLSGDHGSTRPWENVVIQFIHRSAKEFLLNTNNTFLNHDKTPPPHRKFLILQSLALSYLYEEAEDNLPGRDLMMHSMATSKTPLSQDQEIALLELARRLYKENNWNDFYETAAGYGIQNCYNLLVGDGHEECNAARNYLLLCCAPGFSRRTFDMASYLLNKGADLNWLGLYGMELGSQIFYFPRALVYYWFERLYSRFGDFSGVEALRESITYRIDPERKFLSYTTYTGRDYNSYDERTRPLETLAIVDPKFSFITESYGIDASSWTWRRESAIVGLHGLYHRILLFFNKYVVYGVDEEDSKAIHKIIDRPESLRGPPKFSIPYIEETKNKVREIFDGRGKEVDNPVQWLIDRGHMVLRQSDVGDISGQRTFQEMVDIYQRMNDLCNLRWPSSAQRVVEQEIVDDESESADANT